MLRTERSLAAPGGDRGKARSGGAEAGLHGRAEAPPHVRAALRFEGVVERGGANRGPEVDAWLGRLGLAPGQEWCGVFCAAALDEGGAHAPAVRSGLAHAYRTRRSIKASRYRQRGQDVPVGSLAVYKSRHVGIVTGGGPGYVTVISGNTSNPDGGPDGVFEKRRSLAPGSYFRPAFFTPVTYEAK